MIDNAARHQFFMHRCIRCWWNESETEQEKQQKGWKIQRRRGGCRWLQGGARREEERESKIWKIIRRNRNGVGGGCVWGKPFRRRRRLRTHTGKKKDYGHIDQGWKSHSHMEDGLLVSHHLSVSDCQGVVAALQVKILKCQFDYLDSRWSITTVTISEGEESSHSHSYILSHS